MSRVFHLLTEAEAFSEYQGGAISRWTANVLTGDKDAVIIAPSADSSWPFRAEQVRCLPLLGTYKKVQEKTRSRLPWMIRKQMLRTVLPAAMRDLQRGDVLWVHNRPEFAAAIAPLARKAGSKLVLHMHNSHLLQSQKIVDPKTLDRIVFVSRYLEKEARDNVPGLGSSTVLYNGADDKIFYPDAERKKAEHRPIIVFASRLVPEKGVHVFLEAMKSLLERGVDALGWIIGASGFGGSKTTEYVKKLHRDAPANVEFQPYCVGEALGERFRSSDIFCLPSTWQDPFPLAPLEAMATGLPVVATASGGIPEALSGGGGILVQRNSVPELAAALERLIMDAALRRQLGQEGYQSFLQNFTWSAVRNNYQQVVASL